MNSSEEVLKIIKKDCRLKKYILVYLEKSKNGRPTIRFKTKVRDFWAESEEGLSFRMILEADYGINTSSYIFVGRIRTAIAVFMAEEGET